MVKINIDVWLKYVQQMYRMGSRFLKLAKDVGMDTEEVEVQMKMWEMTVSDMEIVQAGRNCGSEFEVV